MENEPNSNIQSSSFDELLLALKANFEFLKKTQ